MPVTTATAAARKPSATDRRSAWLKDVFAPINEAAGAKLHGAGPGAQLTDYARALRRIRTEGPALGRTDAWRGACRWIDGQMSQAERPALTWAVLQGSVWLSHAA